MDEPKKQSNYRASLRMVAKILRAWALLLEVNADRLPEIIKEMRELADAIE